MCARSESVKRVQRAAECLSQACHTRTLRQIYQDTVNEEVPEEIKRLLDRLN